MCTAHVKMIFCHRVDRSFVCKAKEGRRVGITNKLCLYIRRPYLPDYLSKYQMILLKSQTNLDVKLSTLQDKPETV